MFFHSSFAFDNFVNTFETSAPTGLSGVMNISRHHITGLYLGYAAA